MDDTTTVLALYAQHDASGHYAVARQYMLRALNAGISRVGEYWATVAIEHQQEAARDAAIARRLLGIDG